MRILNLTRRHSIVLALYVERMASCSVKLAKISSRIKGYHFYFKSSNFGEILNEMCPRERILSLEAGVIGSPRDDAEGKGVLGGGIEIPCTYKVYGKIDQNSYLRQKIKGTK